MDIPKDSDDKVKLPPLLPTCMVILSITLFHFAIMAVIGPSSEKENQRMNLIFDPDYNNNLTVLCLTTNDPEKDMYRLKWNQSICHNKTLLYWHIPWVKEWLWNKIHEIRTERRRLKHEKEIQQEKLLGDNNNIEVSDLPVQNSEKEPDANDDPANDSPNLTDNQTKPFRRKLFPIDSGKDPTTTAIYVVLTSVTILMTVLACCEIFKDKIYKIPVGEQKDSERRCSLAEFTINRHLRKESMQENLQRQSAFDDQKKVKELLHQGSLDRAFSRLTPKVRLPRQSSMPGKCSVLIGSADILPGSNIPLLRNQSVDLPEDEGSPSMRRKSRHFIRRH